MGEKRLSFNQKLALLPATVPDCVLDFLEDFNFPEPLQNKKSLESIRADFLKSGKQKLETDLRAVRNQGEIREVSVKFLPRRYSGAMLVLLAFEKGKVIIGCIVSQGTGKTGQLSVIVVGELGSTEDAMQQKLMGFYKV